MSTIGRTLSNLRKVGIKDYFRQMLVRDYLDPTFDWRCSTAMIMLTDFVSRTQYIGDTKAGRLIGTDRAGNKFFENNEELPLRTRWVEYAQHDYDAGQIDPGWHAWISYSVDKPPTEDALMQVGKRSFEKPGPIFNWTQTRGAFKTYSTTKPKLRTWEPEAAPRT
ncbi:NADH dehydrogenase [Drechmeria coniospora]|uniref:NADH dehydrogenase [ubiquinone] 1 alpha subcomplex subunit n=1 Tax=Drechmeria coniospora TaxID=98403 RepID=A0A151GUT6_DRECN|nr:NADH dehydrogenase [Drechmeria coniospora]KYK60865.1 NADH dehydrogenase [Drechmeria coniospora]